MARCRTSATPTNRVRRSFTVGFTSPSASRSTICSRRWSASVMSIETPSWKTGADHASVRRRAIVLRVAVIVTTSNSASGRRRPAAAAAVAASPTGAFSTSSATIRPSGPVPASAVRSTPRSRAILRASGDALIRPPRSWRPGPRCVRRRRRRGRGGRAVGAAVVLRPARRSAGGGCGLCARGSAAARRRIAVLDHRDRRADLDLALLDDDLQQDAVDVRLDLLRDLVGVELVEGLTLLDACRLPP